MSVQQCLAPTLKRQRKAQHMTAFLVLLCVYITCNYHYVIF